MAYYKIKFDLLKEAKITFCGATKNILSYVCPESDRRKSLRDINLHFKNRFSFFLLVQVITEIKEYDLDTQH